MSGSRGRAVAALERWRRFQEAQAALVHGEARREADAATRAHEQSKGRAVEAGLQRCALLAADTLDLAHWQAAAAIESGLWRDTERRAQRMAEADAHATTALQQHVQAHALVEVAAQRNARLLAEAQTASEKTDFERVADLRAAHQETLP